MSNCCIRSSHAIAQYTVLFHPIVVGGNGSPVFTEPLIRPNLELIGELAQPRLERAIGV